MLIWRLSVSALGIFCITPFCSLERPWQGWATKNHCDSRHHHERCRAPNQSLLCRRHPHEVYRNKRTQGLSLLTFLEHFLSERRAGVDVGCLRLCTAIAARFRSNGQVSSVVAATRYGSRHLKIVQVSRNIRDTSSARAIACLKAVFTSCHMRRRYLPRGPTGI